MSIEFIVEDGTAKSDATSYLSVEAFKQYWENRGVDYSAKTDAEIQPVLNVATSFIDRLYPYRGQLKDTDQALEFPRAWVVDRNNVSYADEVPPGIKDATAEAARHELEGNDLYEIEEVIQSRSMGPVSVSYGRGGRTQAISRRIERALTDYVAQMGVTR